MLIDAAHDANQHFHTTASVRQVMYTVKEYMQTVTAVDPYWLAESVQLRCHAQNVPKSLAHNAEAGSHVFLSEGVQLGAWMELQSLQPLASWKVTYRFIIPVVVMLIL